MTEHVQGVNLLATNIQGYPRERPWLLPSNRRLRHLEGIFLRNLTLSRPSPEYAGKTTDDDSLPHALRTPTKALVQREAHKLEHSRSSGDLKSTPTLNASIDAQKEDGVFNGSPGKKGRPQIKTVRRRSTLNWINAPPETRQKKLEDVVAEKLADTFFSLHCAGIEEPIYVSEAVESAMNPDFRSFDLNTYGPWVTRRDELTVKYWAKTRKSAGYFLLVELQLHLRSLQFIGKSLERFRHPLPPNCILFHFSDGIYTSFTDLPLEKPLAAPSKPFRNAPNTPQPTSTFDALMRLSNLDNCIQDALCVQKKISSQINSLIQEQHSARSLLTGAEAAVSSLDSSNRAVGSARKALQAAQTRRSDLLGSLAARRAAISSGRLAQQKAESHLSSAQATFSSRISSPGCIKQETRGQSRRIAEDLLQIYPIEPIPDRPLYFTIRDLPLPPASALTTSASHSPEALASALGHAAHVTHLLSHYLSTPLPYPLTPCASTSTIYDPISTTLHSQQARVFPLYSKGAVPFRFEYGVFLLNKDIETLLVGQGVKLVELRHTAGNLRLLLSVLTAGEGELPGRIVGGLGKLTTDKDDTRDTNGELVEGRSSRETRE